MISGLSISEINFDIKKIDPHHLLKWLPPNKIGFEILFIRMIKNPIFHQKKASWIIIKL